ncbi:hypothetical protein N8639_02005 [bacterium]|nr:hypothetical protein [bacterium]
MKTNTHDQKVAEAEGNAIYQKEESQQTATTTQTKLPVIIPHSPKNRSQPNLRSRLSRFIELLFSIYSGCFNIILLMFACGMAYVVGEIWRQKGLFWAILFGFAMFCLAGALYVNRMVMSSFFRILDQQFRKWLKISDE